MKILGLCFLLSSALAANAPAQQLSETTGLNGDYPPIQKWLARDRETRLPRIGTDDYVLSLEERDLSCVYMRTYRVKRESRDSDVTHASGYTKCVPVERFTMKTAVESK
jgi:hypothetical protein